MSQKRLLRCDQKRDVSHLLLQCDFALEDGVQLHHDVTRFAAILRKLALLLMANGAVFWASHVETCLRAVENSDTWGLRRFKEMFGGTGSLNDLVLQRDGSPLLQENDELRALLDEAWILAGELARREL
ncbi:hypothetical protein A6U98_18270 [Rhizobium sp. WYCCWR10014]|uniref:DUF6966 domain-containing protein n=1 Tax=Rhizobium sp. WYCCWR10014 TaxID=1825933 RepID=UPI0007E38BD6|nr:hypothetical protein [Rhizobium sp. WYCCWR10014]OAV51592.1 hypothetical protein A6U98_18270 [Rhizobium sp. WYCCWR10014]